MEKFSLEELRFAARFPFTKTAKKILSSTSFQVTYDKMQFAKKRVLENLFSSNVSVLIAGDQELYEKYLVSYPLSRMIISFFDSQVRSKFVIAETKKAIVNITADNPNFIDEAKRIASDLGIVYDGLNVSVETYLENIPKTPEGRLGVQNIKNGKVLLNENGFLSMVGEAIKNNIEAGLPIHQDSIPKDVLPEIQNIVKEIESEINLRKEQKEKSAIYFAKTTGEIAPCMAKILERARNGENLSHFARVAIASYLLKRGKPIEEVIEVFSATPNYNEKIARYQVEFIAKRGYNPPSCQAMESYGLCIQECRLANPKLKNPLGYGSRFVAKKRRSRRI